MFSLGGLFFIVGGLTADEINNAPPAWYVRLGFCLFALLFILVGLVAIGFFKKTSINRRLGSLTRKKGVFFASSEKTEDISGVSSVILSKEIRVRETSDSHRTRTYYPIKLKVSDHEEFVAETTGDAIHARRTAEGLATFLNLQMIDRSREETVTRNPDELNMGIAERWIRNGEKAEYPECPDSMNNRVKDLRSERETFTSLYFPSMASQCPKAAPIWVSVMMALLGLIVYLVWPNTPSQDLGEFARMLLSNAFSFWVIVLALLFLFVAYTIIEGLVAKEIRLNPKCIFILHTFLGITRTTRVECSELEEIDLDEDALTFITDRKRIKVIVKGRSEEVIFCANMITYVLLK
jgi:hypothetical protein